MESGFNAARLIGNELETCQGAPEEVKLLATWFKEKAGDRQKMVDAASANAHLYSQQIQQHVEEVWDVFFKYNEPYKTGVALGKTAFWALGPANPDVHL